MIRAVADTHTFIWYLAGDRRLSPAAQESIDTAAKNGDTVAVSSISLIEAVYLMEKGRISAEAFSALVAQLLAPDGIFTEVPVDHRVAEIMRQVAWAEVPDMPDRIVAATAQYFGVPLISRDGRLQASGIQTIW